MANVKVTALAELTTPVDDDEFLIVDDSEAGSEKSKRISYESLVKAILPPGMVAPFAMAAPTGWLECDGSAVSRTTYANLFAAISDDYGAGNGTTTFNLPNYQGYFLRGQDNSAGVDPDAASRTDRGDGTGGDIIGSKQTGGNENHTHSTQLPYTGYGTGTSAGGLKAGYLQTDNSGNTWHTTSAPAVTSGSNSDLGTGESRPININVLYCIKY